MIDTKAIVNERAKIFWTGRSQAVRLPKQFRFDATEVSVRREGDSVILEPLNEWPVGWVASFTSHGTKFERAPQGQLDKRKARK